ncbi:MAG: type II toxin-antitoxin system Phd/YefM family antitoxin [Planctomycetes bacterium]|nr:type II toxin-antitoxin system Phd/YefM family antitoxin [Planctomycetota bacterium]
MPIQTTYTNARAKLAELFDQVTDNQEIVIVKRRRADDVAIISAEELSSLMETAHLLRSPKNLTRLLSALNRAQARTLKTRTVESLRKELGLKEHGLGEES